MDKMRKVWVKCVIGMGSMDSFVVSLVYRDSVREAFNQMIEMKKWKEKQPYGTQLQSVNRLVLKSHAEESYGGNSAIWKISFTWDKEAKVDESIESWKRENKIIQISSESIHEMYLVLQIYDKQQLSRLPTVSKIPSIYTDRAWRAKDTPIIHESATFLSQKNRGLIASQSLCSFIRNVFSQSKVDTDDAINVAATDLYMWEPRFCSANAIYCLR